MLTDDQIWDLWNAQGTDDMSQAEAFQFARAIEETVMARDEVLIRQLLEALAMETTPPAKREQEIERAIAAARTRLDKGGQNGAE